MTFRDQLTAMSACGAAVEWVGTRTLEQAWAECERGDWMLWLAARANVDRKLLVLAACDCAETAIQYVREDSLLAVVWAIDAARRWSAGVTDLDEVRAAAYAAYAAGEGSAAYSAYAAASAADAAYAASYAAYAADAAYAAGEGSAAYAAYAADAAAQRSSLAHSAALALVRARIRVADIAAAMRVAP